MLANSSEYKQRLVRMKMMGVDCTLAARRRVGANPVEAAGLDRDGSIVAGQRLIANSKVGSEHRKPNSSSSLWMRQPHRNRRKPSQQRRQQSQQPEQPTEPTTQLLDQQTNNSRLRSLGRSCSINPVDNNSSSSSINHNSADLMESADANQSFPSSEESHDIGNKNAVAKDIGNKNAVAKGANALVKHTTSRPTEIIDTSKLLEEGKVEVEYEEPEEPEEIEEPDNKLIDEYEKTLAYARRLRALLNMDFKVLDPSSIETNFLLVKAHEHPTQRVTDRWRNVDLGQPYDSQIRSKKLVDEFKQTVSQKKSKRGAAATPVYPDWLRFVFRFKKSSPERRWAEFTAYRQRMKKLSGGKVTVPKANEMYTAAFYDIWSTSVVVFAKPESNLLNMADPVFSKLGLDARADFKFTLGCFVGDKRTGKSKVQGVPPVAEEVATQTMCSDLYKRNCVDIFVNDNRVEMFQLFPTFFPGGDANVSTKEAGKGKKGGSKSSQNQSNWGLETDPGSQLLSDITAPISQAAGSSSHGDATPLGDLAKTSIAEEAVAFDVSSPAATNQNLSIHDCDSSEDSAAMIPNCSSTTKSCRTETTRKT